MNIEGSNDNSLKYPRSLPPQHQNKQPGCEQDMNPKPIFDRDDYIGSNKLKDKVAIVTGGDSGIGKAVAIAFAKEGADVVIAYYDEHNDAQETKKLIEEKGRKCLLINGDIGDELVCNKIVNSTVAQFGKIDILVNNAAEQHPQNSIEDITKEQLIRTFETNIFSMFYLTKAALKHMGEGSSIINTASVTAYAGNETLIDYSATKGAVVTFTRSMALSLASKKIRVNGVAPGPIWTPLIPSSFSKNKVSEFGNNVPMGRPGQPVEIAPSYVFLACNDSSYMSGEMIHINGGKIVNA